MLVNIEMSREIYQKAERALEAALISIGATIKEKFRAVAIDTWVVDIPDLPERFRSDLPEGSNRDPVAIVFQRDTPSIGFGMTGLEDVHWVTLDARIAADLQAALELPEAKIGADGTRP